MLTLAAADTLAGVATDNTEVTYTIFGDQITTGDAFTVLAQGQLANAAATIYTSPGATSSLISSITFVNNAGTVETVTLYRGGTVAANAIATFQIPVGGTAQFDGSKLEVHDAAGGLKIAIPLSTAVPQRVSTTTGVAGTSGLAADALHVHQQAALSASGGVAVSDSAGVAGSSGVGSDSGHSHQHGALGGGTDHAEVTDSVDGFMSVADKTKLDGIGGGLSNPITDAQHGSRGGTTLHSAATDSAAGFIAAADKTKLDGVVGTHMTTTQTVTVTSSTGIGLTGLNLALPIASQAYAIDAMVLGVSSATSSTAMGVGLTIPVGATMTAAIVGATNLTASRNAYFTATGACQGSFITTTGFTGPILIDAVVVLGTATGSVQVIANAASGTATVATGSSIDAVPIS